MGEVTWVDIQVCNDGPFVAAIDGVGGICSACAGEGMMPFGGHCRACWYADDSARHWLVVWVDAAIADDVFSTTRYISRFKNYCHPKGVPLDVTSVIG